MPELNFETIKAWLTENWDAILAALEKLYNFIKAA